MNEKVAGLGLVAIICTSQVLSALTSKIAVQSLDAPFFLMWIHTLMMALMWPLGLAMQTLPVLGVNSSIPSRGGSDNNTSQQASQTTGEQRLDVLVQRAKHKIPRMLRLIVLLFYPLWIASNYCYVAALKHVPASTMVSIFGSCTAFVSLEEWIWLGQPCTVVRVLSVLLAFGGVLAYGFSEGTPEHSASTENEKTHETNDWLFGVLLGTVSSLSAATYKVAFKKFLGSPDRIDVCLFLSALGVVNGGVGILPTLALAHWGVEQPFYDSRLTGASWGVIWCGSLFVLVFNASIAFGIAVTSPLFIAVGTVLTIPVTDSIDYFWIDHGGERFGGTGQIAASLAIVTSFLLTACFDRHSVVVVAELLESNEDNMEANDGMTPNENEGPLQTIAAASNSSSSNTTSISTIVEEEMRSLVTERNSTRLDLHFSGGDNGENSIK